MMMTDQQTKTCIRGERVDNLYDPDIAEKAVDQSPDQGRQTRLSQLLPRMAHGGSSVADRGLRRISLAAFSAITFRSPGLGSNGFGS